MPKIAIHIFHDDPDSIATGTRIAQRVEETAPQVGCGVEVFCFGPAQRRLTMGDGSEANATFNRQVDELIAHGVVVGACVNAAHQDGTEEQLVRRG